MIIVQRISTSDSLDLKFKKKVPEYAGKDILHCIETGRENQRRSGKRGRALPSIVVVLLLPVLLAMVRSNVLNFRKSNEFFETRYLIYFQVL